MKTIYVVYEIQEVPNESPAMVALEAYESEAAAQVARNNAKATWPDNKYKIQELRLHTL